MPVLSRLYGIVLRIYFQQSEHNPSYIHAKYGEDILAFNIKTGEILEGELPKKAISMVREWIELNKKELFNIWETQDFRAWPPLE